MIHPTLTGVLVLLALGFLMPSLAYIPKAILASVIITSVIFMVELEELKPMWKSRSTSVSNPKI
jgi:sodium-independent sulfate anion transporter 11